MPQVFWPTFHFFYILIISLKIEIRNAISDSFFYFCFYQKMKENVCNVQFFIIPIEEKLNKLNPFPFLSF